MDILFNSKTPEFSWLSNFSPHPVGTQPTAEHAYQACKFLDPTIWQQIRNTRGPGAVKRLVAFIHEGRHPDWYEQRQEYMARVLRRKFTDHPVLKWALIGTYPHRLVHLAPWDTYWGENGKDVGHNHMGNILMEIRDDLRRATS